MAGYNYQIEVTHSGLNKYRIVKGATPYETQRKADALRAQWEEQWKKKLEREQKIRNEEQSMEYADELTRQAEGIQEALDNILVDSLDQDSFDLQDLKDVSQYEMPEPIEPRLEDIPIEPIESDERYNPKPSFLTKIIKSKMDEFQRKNKQKFEYDHRCWEKNKQSIIEKNKMLMSEFEDKKRSWQHEFKTFYKQQQEHNNRIDILLEGLENREAQALEQYFIYMFENISIPIQYERYFNVEVLQKDKQMIVDLLMPEIGDIPTLKAVKYLKSKKEYKEVHYTESYIKKKYDNVIYQLVLMYINNIFAVEEADWIEYVVVNGRVKTIDKATGNMIEPCVLSVGVKRENFENINLSAVDAKTWFKNARGVSASSIANITPVMPIIEISKEDKRFIDGYGVIEGLDETVNLASMDWKDFENLIREIFEMEFSEKGGEVKITQASRDGGVDAIAFDPDPIRGGKIVIQAKRYTNVVGVSAVRDLYGTVMNEGAMKGILVTTSNYGSDSYEFVNGKPITLINGAQLLGLLEKYGHKARINIKEAKQQLK